MRPDRVGVGLGMHNAIDSIDILFGFVDFVLSEVYIENKNTLCDIVIVNDVCISGKPEGMTL